MTRPLRVELIAVPQNLTNRLTAGSQAPANGRNYNPIPVSEPQERILTINRCQDIPFSDWCPDKPVRLTAQRFADAIADTCTFVSTACWPASESRRPSQLDASGKPVWQRAVLCNFATARSSPSPPPTGDYQSRVVGQRRQSPDL